MTYPLARKIASRYLQATQFRNIKPNDTLTMYHGTDYKAAFQMINGFDATKEYSRLYNQSRHRGLFVTPSFALAEKFASHGAIVLELQVRAKFLHGVSYGGTIGRHQDLDEKTKVFFRDKYPDSFRPYLSFTLNQSPEPQALLVGMVAPNQIKRVWYNPSQKDGQWYSRKDFLDLGVEVNIEGRSQVIKDLGFDRSKTNYTLQQFLDAASKGRGFTTEKIFEILSTNFLDETGMAEAIMRTFKFEEKAARAFAKLVLGETTKSLA